MGAEAALKPRRLPVAPGGEALTEISVKNGGTVVDSFTLRVLGDAAPWATCEPDSISLLPGNSGVARIIVRPPASSDLPNGPMPFAVRVASSEDPPGSVVEEGVLEVGALSLVTADLSPRTGRARGMRPSRHRLAVDNRGNAPVVVGIAGGDDGDTVDVTVKPAQLEVPPGSAAFADVRVRARRRFWRGPGVTHRFQVTAHSPIAGPGAYAPIRREGTMLQEAVLPDWLPKAIALTAAAAVALVALWFAVLRPAVRDAATSAGTAAAQRALNQALQQSAAAGGAAGSGGTAASSGSSPKPSPTASTGGKGAAGKGGAGKSPGSPSPAPAGSATPNPTGVGLPPPVPFAKTLSASNPGVTSSAKHALALTDLVMQNPAGDQGTLTVSRGGQVLFSEQLANFRDYDLHFITAIMIPAGQSLTMSVNCKNPGGKACTPVVLISGMNDTTSL